MATTVTPSLRTGSILIVDDEVKILKLLSRSLVRQGHDVTVTTDPSQAARLLGVEQFDVLIVDHRMPELTGLELLKRIHDAASRPEVIMMTAYGTVESAVQAMKWGAADYIQKPFDFDSMKQAVRLALGRREQRAIAVTRPPSAPLPGKIGRHGLIGRSPAIKRLLARIEAVSPTDSTILITGETGSGKELVARAIHQLSGRRSMPLVRVNCAAIPDGLLESEMFGHVRGAFTGATQTRRGKFALAHGGSLFLDEVSGLSGPLQQKLLRVLQEKEFEPLGSERTSKVDVRILAASNQDLSRLTAEGRFQEDLYYRLNVIPLRVPPLRERRDDIPPLAEAFLARFSRKLGKPFRGYSRKALESLVEYDWPGNVRELENAVERAVALGSPPLVLPEDFKEGGPGFPPDPTLPTLDLRENLGRITKQTILESLERVNGRKKDAAALLGISQRALSYYLRKYQL